MNTEKMWSGFKRSGSQELREALFTHYFHLVRWVAYQIGLRLPAHVERSDLVSTGIQGLVKAIEQYDLERTNKFETFAVILIRGAIIDELRALDWVPRTVRDKANQVKLAEEELKSQLGREASSEELAKHLEMDLDDFQRLRLQIRPAIVLPLQDVPSLAAPAGECAEQKEKKAFLKKAIGALSKQEQKVIKLYYYEEMTLKAVGAKLGVGESRISQIHSKAISSLRTYFNEYFDSC